MVRIDFNRLIPQLFRQGTIRRGSYLDVKYRLGRPHFVTIIVAKKLSKLATARNRTRRIIYATLFPSHRDQLAPFQLIVIAKKLANTKQQSQELRNELRQLVTVLH